MTTRCTVHGWLDCASCPRRQQFATIDLLSAEMVRALDRGDRELARCLDQAIGRALESPEAAADEQVQFDSRDPFGL
jgi:hypothetical protein